MIEVLAELRRRAHDVTWTVYGTGDFEPEMRQRIRRAGLENVITMAGTVPYPRFWQVLKDAYVFVGMGTSILEAALFKVPNVNAIPYDLKGITDGPVYRFPPGSIGPATLPTLKVVDEIERILRLTPDEYQAEQERVHEHVRVHEMETSMRLFLDLANAVPPFRRRRCLFAANYVRWLVDRAFNPSRADQPVRHPGFPIFPKTDMGTQPSQ
jgi:hypothetical protein